MQAYRLYVACQSDDDLPYVLKYTGEDNMLMGTDYGHHDHAADLEGSRNLQTAGGISERVYNKIVDANPYVRELLAQRNAPGTFGAYRMSSIGAFHSLVMAGLPDRFPHLRMVFVEIASQWVPWTLKDLARRLPQQRGRTLPENPLKAYRLYVACQSDDDLPYVLTYTGEDNMMMGTDYGHHDHAADLEGLRNLKTAGGISARVYDKIVDANPRAAYAL